MDTTAARIPERWGTPIRIATALIALLHLGLFAAGIQPRYGELTQICEPEACEPLEPTASDAAALEELGLSLHFYAVFHIGIEVALVLGSILLVGLLFWRASHLWVGTVAILTMSYIAVFVANVIYALGEIAPGLYPLVLLAYIPGMISLMSIFYIFPDGRFYPRWTIIPPLVLIPIAVTVSALDGGDYIETQLVEWNLLLILSGVCLLSALIFGFITQMVRYRKYYDHLQKQQTRWLIVAIVGLFLGILTWGIVFESKLIPYGPARILSSFIGMTVLMLFSVGMIPYALTIAILRYRLWNIDLIIRRTLQYSSVTAVLGLTYFGSVVLLQTSFRGITGSSSSIAIVISTLVIAALFNPLRLRIQQVVDRRFFRENYDAQLTLDRFSEQLRSEVDLDDIQDELLSVLNNTMQPESLSLWLAQVNDRSRE